MGGWRGEVKHSGGGAEQGRRARHEEWSHSNKLYCIKRRLCVGFIEKCSGFIAFLRLFAWNHQKKKNSTILRQRVYFLCSPTCCRRICGLLLLLLVDTKIPIFPAEELPNLRQWHPAAAAATTIRAVWRLQVTIYTARAALLLVSICSPFIQLDKGLICPPVAVSLVKKINKNK